MTFVKKTLKVFLITVLVIFVLLLTIPFFVKGKIIEIAHNELNRMLTAKVDFSDIKLSLIRNFPNVYVALEDMTVICDDVFEGDTLITFRKFSVTVGVMSAIRTNQIKLKSAQLDGANLYLHVLKNGCANWDIVKFGKTTKITDEETNVTAEKTAITIEKTLVAAEKTEVVAEKTKVTEQEKKISAENTSTAPFKVALRKLRIRHTNITYRNESIKTAVTLKDFNYLLRGNMGRNKTNLNMKLDVAEVDFWKKGNHYLKKIRVGFVSKITADLKNKEFTFKRAQFILNEMSLKLAGSIQTPADGANFDLTFSSDRKDFKSLLSLAPAIDIQDLEKMQTSGNFNLNGNLKGVYNDRQTPTVDLHLIVENAMFKYPDLPKSVDKINIAAKVFYDGVTFDRTTVNIDKFYFEMADNPIDAEIHVKTPDSDMQVDAKLVGTIDFNALENVIPLDSVRLKGLLECDLALAGRMSALKKEQYKDFKATGELKLTDFSYESPKLPEGMDFAYIKLKFTPQLFKNLLDFAVTNSQ